MPSLKPKDRLKIIKDDIEYEFEVAAEGGYMVTIPEIPGCVSEGATFEEALEMIRSDKHRAALGFDSLTYIRSVEESKALNGRKDPMVIISASGMLEAGRVLHHLKNNADDKNSTVLIVSWQAPHTLGRRLLEGQKKIKIYGEVIERKFQVERIRGFSAHGGQHMLRDYALSQKGRVKNIFLVHGEQRGADGLTEVLEAEGMEKPHFPEMNSFVEL